MTTKQFNDKVLKRIREIEHEMAAIREKERLILPTLTRLSGKLAR
jgi:hypothetical protein